MKKRNRVKIFVSFLLIVIIGGGNISTLADSTDEKVKENVSEQSGFTVESIPSDQQIDKDFSFFYIRTRPSEEQTLKVKITSKRKEPSVIKLYLTNAVTSTIGQIDYSKPDPILDESMKYPLKDFVSLQEKEITVKNFEEKTVEINVTPPKDSYSGVRLGAIVFESNDIKKDSQGVKSAYGYKIAIMTSEDQRPYNEDGKINYVEVNPKLYNGQKVVAMTVQNPMPKVLENLTIKTEIRKKGGDEVLASNGLTGMKMAPNSNFDFLTYLGLESLKPGNYVIKSVATDGKEEWRWTKEFTISDYQANQLNEDAAYKLGLSKLYRMSAIILLIVTTLNISYLIYRRRRRKMSEKV